jgi:ankyrin repeat protein
MNWRRTAGLWLLVFGLAGTAVAAEKAALADAAEQRNAALLRKLLDAGADVNAAQVDGMTALHWAVYNDDAASARMLVRAGAKVNAVNRYGVPPLSLACTNANADMVKLLLEAARTRRRRFRAGRRSS